MNPKINDGKYGCWFMWGLGTDYAKADMLGADKIHMEMVQDFSGKGERAIFTDSWSYVLNKASKNKDAAVKFLQYMADEGGMELSSLFIKQCKADFYLCFTLLFFYIFYLYISTTS